MKRLEQLEMNIEEYCVTWYCSTKTLWILLEFNDIYA